MARVAHRLSRIHKILGLVIGIQFLFWTVSGFFFTLYPIEVIHGDHLKQDAYPTELALEGERLVPFETFATRLNGETEGIRLKPFLDGPVYEVTSTSGTALFDARTGVRITPLGATRARRIAEQSWAGEGELSRIVLLEHAPRESGLKGNPAWRAEFKGRQSATFYINPHNGELRSVRTGIWRVFDFLWGLHIMNWATREDFNTWWLKIVSFAAITMVLLGFGILIDRARKGRLLK